MESRLRSIETGFHELKDSNSRIIELLINLQNTGQQAFTDTTDKSLGDAYDVSSLMAKERILPISPEMTDITAAQVTGYTPYQKPMSDVPTQSGEQTEM